MIDHFVRAPSPQCHLIIEQLGGASARVPSEAIAFYHRQMPYDLLILGVWAQAEQRESCVRWARELWQSMQPLAGSGAYVNYMGPEADEGTERVRSTYGANYARLTDVERIYDPTNLFRLNQNIKPAA